MKKLSLYFLFLMLIIAACKSNNSKKSIDKTEKPQKDLIVYTLKDEKSFDKQMMEIDSFVLAYGKFVNDTIKINIVMIAPVLLTPILPVKARCLCRHP